MEIVYILLEKELGTNVARVVGVYDDYDLAEEIMEEHMKFYEEERAYKIESKMIARKNPNYVGL